MREQIPQPKRGLAARTQGHFRNKVSRIKMTLFLVVYFLRADLDILVV